MLDASRFMISQDESSHNRSCPFINPAVAGQRERSATEGRKSGRLRSMCRNIKPLFNFEPPATDEEIRLSSLQFVRKISGYARPSRANEEAFNRAVDEVATAAHRLLGSLVTESPARNREEEEARRKARSAGRFRS